MFGQSKGSISSALREFIEIHDDPEAGLRSHVLKKDTHFQTRRAQGLREDFAVKVRAVCEHERSIQICYVFDAKWPPSGQEGLLIVLALDNGTDIREVAQKLMDALKGMPEAERTLVAPTKAIAARYQGAEFYQRASHVAE